MADGREQLLYSARQVHQQALAFLSNKIDLALYASDVIYYDFSVHRLILSSVSQPQDLGNEYRDFYTVCLPFRVLHVRFDAAVLPRWRYRLYLLELRAGSRRGEYMGLAAKLTGHCGRADR